MLVLEDGAPARRSKIEKAARENLGSKNLVLSPSSPDLNAIAFLWHIVCWKVSVMKPKAGDLERLWEQVQACMG